MKPSRDTYLETIQSCQSLSNVEKQKYKDGWNRLINLLGEQWLSSLDDDHPLLFWIKNPSPWAIKWVSDLGNKLDGLQALNRFKTLLKKLERSEFSETLSEVEIFSRLKMKKCEIKLYPKLDSGGEADCKATKDGKESWWEITTTMESGHEKNIQCTWHALYRPPNNGINVRFKIYRSLTKDEIMKYGNLIDRKIREAKSGSGFEEIHIPGVMDYYIATDDQFHRIPEEMQGSLSIPLGVDQGQRILDKINGELQQLPSDKPGIIAIFNNYLWPENVNGDLIRQIRGIIEFHKQVHCVFITITTLGQGKESEIEFEDHTLIQRTRYDEIVERTFVIKNPKCKLDVHLIEIYR